MEPDAVQALLTSRTLHGFDRPHAALWLRHAAACAGFHQEREKLGIPEPPRLDPLCGAAALAACLRARHLPADKKTVLAACRVTGRGSSLQDILNAGPKLGVRVRAVTADDLALKAMPLPAVAYVERDHFIAVVSANDRGVNYLCSDCGPWPGGRVHLSWKQWHALTPTAYGLVTPTNSPSDRWLHAVLSAVPTRRTTLANPHRAGAAPWNLPDLGRLLPSPATLAMHLVAMQAGQVGNNICGFANNSLQCPSYLWCPWNCPGHCPTGPLGGDPVNLANGEEEFKAPADLVVYNPNGPAVVWQREYENLRGYDPAYEDSDFGYGWTHPYNVGIFDPKVAFNPQVLSGITTSLTPSGTDAPASGTWDIVLGGTVLANAAVPGGWNVTYTASSNQLNITVPASANSNTGYEARYHSGSVTVSVIFDVIPPHLVIGGVGPIPVPINGADKPVGASWDITANGTVIASSVSPNGWNVTYSIANYLMVTAPSTAPIGPQYEARYFPTTQILGRRSSSRGRACQANGANPNNTGGGGTNQPLSATFTMGTVRFYPLAGSKSIVEANGAHIAFSAPSVPTAANPQVACSVGAGVPMQVTWNYNSGNTFGYYTVLLPDRTVWTTTAVSQFIYAPVLTLNQNTSAVYQLGKLTDHNGNSLNFVYGAAGSSGFPLLTSIGDSGGSALLTFTRATDGSGNITSVSDRYGRSVSYHDSVYYNNGVPLPYPQAFSEVDHVSQIVATGTQNPPDRVVYGYTTVPNAVNEGIITLYTITVPSPTGTGTSVATLGYANFTNFVNAITDGNGNIHNYSFIDNSHNQVKVTNSAGTVIYVYTVGFAPNMSGTTVTDGTYTVTQQKAPPGGVSPPPVYTNTNIVRSFVFSDPNDPYRPSVVYDGNGYAAIGTAQGAAGLGKWEYTWDRYGHLTTATTPYGTITDYTWNYTVFPFGELTQVQEGAKSPVTISYYEPSGNIQQINMPKPGTVGSNETVSTKATWSALGNRLTSSA